MKDKLKTLCYCCKKDSNGFPYKEVKIAIIDEYIRKINTVNVCKSCYIKKVRVSLK